MFDIGLNAFGVDKVWYAITCFSFNEFPLNRTGTFTGGGFQTLLKMDDVDLILGSKLGRIQHWT